MDIDQLVDLCAATGDLAGSSTLEHIRQHRAAPLVLCVSEPPKQKCRRTVWTKTETEYLRDHLGKLSLAEIAQALGRSENAIHVRIVRKNIPNASKRPGYLTGNQVAKLFRVDIHSVMRWQKTGILEMEILPGMRGIMSVHIRMVYRWAVQPRNWLYFKAERIRDPHLRKLVFLAQSRWDDEWWTIGRAARYHGVHTRLVNLHIRSGKLDGTQWGNWYLKKSDVVNYVFYTGKGAYRAAQMAVTDWTPRADAWILRANDELGMTYAEIAGRMKGAWTAKRVCYRYGQLKRGEQA
jgi:hypothetical protein